MAVDPDGDVDDEGTVPPPKLAAVAEQLLALAAEEARVRDPEVSDADRLLDVLTLVGRLHALCNTHAGFFASDPMPVDDEGACLGG